VPPADWVGGGGLELACICACGCALELCGAENLDPFVPAEADFGIDAIFADVGRISFSEFGRVTVAEYGLDCRAPVILTVSIALFTSNSIFDTEAERVPGAPGCDAAILFGSGGCLELKATPFVCESVFLHTP